MPLSQHFIECLSKDGIDINLLRISPGGRQLDDHELMKVYPVPPPFAMWGTPTGHLRQYTTFGGTLKPKYSTLSTLSVPSVLVSARL